MESGDVLDQALSLESMAWLCELQGDLQTAVEYNRRALECVEDHGDVRKQSVMHNSYGWRLARTGQYDTARVHCERAESTQRELGDEIKLTQTLDSLGYIALQTGALNDAVAYYSESLRLCRDHSSMSQAAETEASLGDTYAALADTHRARECWDNALTRFRRLHRLTKADAVAAKLANLPDPSGNTAGPSRPTV